jgi:hypothetical protein
MRLTRDDLTASVQASGTSSRIGYGGVEAGPIGHKLCLMIGPGIANPESWLTVGWWASMQVSEVHNLLCTE